MSVNGPESLGKDLKGCIPNEYGDFWRGRGREILFYYILGEEILALPVMIVLLDKNVLGEIEN